jgi:peptidoglycan/xylan/chitin deacetylase (PgdA/CDA1 family)
LAGSALALLAIGALLYFTVLTVAVSVDGKNVRLKAGSTVSDLFAKDLIHRAKGDLVSAKKARVLQPGGGKGPYLTRDGEILAGQDRLGGSWVLVSHDGQDVVEPTRVTTESIPVPTRYEGSGTIENVVKDGTPGVREVTTGAISGEVAGKREVLPPVAKIVRRQEAVAGAKVVALTFDDGPSPLYTRKILSILKKYGIKATFFEIGRSARAYPSLSRELAKAGMEMANHTETHPLNLGKLSAKAVSSQITMAQYDIKKASGQAPRFFRPPGGNTTSSMYGPLDKLGLGWVQWDIDTEDWQRPPADKIVSRVVSRARPGSVVLMHDGGGDRSHTVEALPKIIERLQAKGYGFVTVSQLGKVPHRMG